MSVTDQFTNLLSGFVRERDKFSNARHDLDTWLPSYTDRCSNHGSDNNDTDTVNETLEFLLNFLTGAGGTVGYQVSKPGSVVLRIRDALRDWEEFVDTKRRDGDDEDNRHSLDWWDLDHRPYWWDDSWVESVREHVESYRGDWMFGLGWFRIASSLSNTVVFDPRPDLRERESEGWEADEQPILWTNLLGQIEIVLGPAGQMWDHRKISEEHNGYGRITFRNQTTAEMLISHLQTVKNP